MECGAERRSIDANLLLQHMDELRSDEASCGCCALCPAGQDGESPVAAHQDESLGTLGGTPNRDPQSHYHI